MICDVKLFMIETKTIQRKPVALFTSYGIGEAENMSKTNLYVPNIWIFFQIKYSLIVSYLDCLETFTYIVNVESLFLKLEFDNILCL